MHVYICPYLRLLHIGELQSETVGALNPQKTFRNVALNDFCRLMMAPT